MVLERIQQDTPKTFWVVAAIGLQTHKYLFPPVSGNYFFHAALCSISGFLVSFLPVYLSQFLFSLCNSKSGFSSFPQTSLPGCLPTYSQRINLDHTRIVFVKILCAHFSISHSCSGEVCGFLVFFFSAAFLNVKLL